LRRGLVHKEFGPTYPGEAMRYPGVWFAFDEDGIRDGGAAQLLTKKQDTDAERERAQEVKRVVVCQGARVEDGREEGERDGLDEVIECPIMHGELKRAVVRIKSGVKLYFHSISSPPPEPIQIRIGRTSAEDLICDLGPPLRIHYKEDDRMTIHATDPAGSADDSDEGYFYNYFQHGMDILLSGTTHLVKKIILHSNIPGSLLFQRYKRCPWEIDASPEEGSEDSSNNVSFHDKIEDITSVLNPSSREAPQSMILDRSADFPDTLTLPGSTTRLTGFDGVVLEVSEIGDVLTVMLF